jgi:hypothetical protein
MSAKENHSKMIAEFALMKDKLKSTQDELLDSQSKIKQMDEVLRLKE